MGEVEKMLGKCWDQKKRKVGDKVGGRFVFSHMTHGGHKSCMRRMANECANNSIKKKQPRDDKKYNKNNKEGKPTWRC